jgi:bacteriocin biosynthesis cyclodehydratase domain-containing protein
VENVETSETRALPLDHVRPKMLRDSIFLPTKGGVFFRRGNQSFTLKGGGVYELVSSLLPFLGGELNVSEICRQVGIQKSKSIKRMISILLERHIAIDHIHESTNLEGDALKVFQAQIEFIEHFSERPVERFIRFRRGRVLLTGSGIPLRAMALSLARNGLETLILDDRASELERDDEIAEVAQRFRSSGVPICFERAVLKHVLSGRTQAVSAICYAGDAPEIQELLAINQFCCAEQIPFFPGFLLNGKAFVGPLLREHRAGCLLCFLLRHGSCIDPVAEARLWRSIALGDPWRNDGQPEASPSLRILGNTVAFEFFRLAVGNIPTETTHSLVCLDLETLETNESRLLPHPLCPHCSRAEPDDDYSYLSSGHTDSSSPGSDLKGKVDSSSTLIDPNSGIAMRFQDDDLVQIPLFRSSLVVSRQIGALESPIPGYSLESNAGARLQAILSAVRSYELEMVDERRLLKATKKGALQANLYPTTDSVLTGWTGGASKGGEELVAWMHALSLGRTKNRICLVPATAVYTRAPMNQGEFERADAGTGIGFTFEEACKDAIYSAFACEILKRVARDEVALVEVTSSWLSRAGADGRYLVNSFRHLHQPLRVLVFAHSGCGSVALAFPPGDRVDPARIIVGYAESPLRAATAAMTEFLAISIGGESVHTVEYFLPQSLRYSLDLNSRNYLPEEWLPVQDVTDHSPESVLRAFGGCFTDILIVNLSTKDILSCGMFAVRALFAMQRGF